MHVAVRMLWCITACMFSLKLQEKERNKALLDNPGHFPLPNAVPLPPNGTRSPGFPELLRGFITSPASGEVTHGTETSLGPTPWSWPDVPRVLGGPGLEMQVGFLPELGQGRATEKRADPGPRGRAAHLQRADPGKSYLATIDVTVGRGLTG